MIGTYAQVHVHGTTVLYCSTLPKHGSTTLNNHSTVPWGTVIRQNSYPCPTHCDFTTCFPLITTKTHQQHFHMMQTLTFLVDSLKSIKKSLRTVMQSDDCNEWRVCVILLKSGEHNVWITAIEYRVRLFATCSVLVIPSILQCFWVTSTYIVVGARL